MLDVLIRRHRAIAKATGIAVLVPGEGRPLLDALAEGLLLRGRTCEELTLDLGLDDKAQQLELQWASAGERERQSRTRYAQHTICPEEVAAEVDEVRAALGGLLAQVGTAPFRLLQRRLPRSGTGLVARGRRPDRSSTP